MLCTNVCSILIRRTLLLANSNPSASWRLFHVSVAESAGQKWRLRNGKSRSGNEYGPLTDLPDWTFVDGRPPMLGKGQLRRQVKQFAFSKRIRRLLDEMDAAKLPSGSQEDGETDPEEVEAVKEMKVKEEGKRDIEVEEKHEANKAEPDIKVEGGSLRSK